jgi:hypothetical protein
MEKEKRIINRVPAAIYYIMFGALYFKKNLHSTNSIMEQLHHGVGEGGGHYQSTEHSSLH